MYRTIAASFWTDPKVRKLSPEGKLLLLYLITNPHTHVSGIYVLDLRYAGADIGMNKNTLSTNLNTLSAGGFCAFDASTSVVWVRKMMAYQGKGEKNLRSAAYHITEDLHGSYLCDQFLAAYPMVQKYLTPTFKERRQSLPNALRLKILERDGNRCKKCGATAEEASLEVDHVLAVVNGGTDDEDNLETLCQPCNLGKADTVSLNLDRVSDFSTPDSRSRFLIPEQKTEQETERLAHGEHGHALLTPDEFLKLKQKLNSHAEDFIRQFDEWVHEAPSAKHNGVRRKDRNPYASICKWYDRAVKEGRVKSPGAKVSAEDIRRRHGI